MSDGPPPRPAATTAFLRAVGPRWAADIRAAGEATRAHYAPLRRPAAGVERVRDIPYGADPRQVLDVHRRPGLRGAPVVAFVHGGAFVRGAKDAPDGTYGNVLDWFAEQGCVGVNVEYRLAPEAPYPEGALDVAAACAWIRANAAAFGGDPQRLCLVGHSAGGTHVATLACDPHPAVRAAPPHGARSLVLVSARLRADVSPANPTAEGVRAYMGEDDVLDARSPVTHAALVDAPVLVVTAEFENPLLDLYGLEFALAVGRARGVAPLHVALADHNHVSVVAHIGTEERWLGDAILRFAAAAA